METLWRLMLPWAKSNVQGSISRKGLAKENHSPLFQHGIDAINGINRPRNLTEGLGYGLHKRVVAARALRPHS